MPEAERPGDLLQLSPDEAGHLVRVLRLTAGAAVRVFNGRGGEFDALVQTIGKSGVRVQVGPICEPAPEVAVAITLVQAVLKGDQMDEVVRDAVMMGVAAVQPVVAARSEVSLASLRRAHRRERWQRIAVSSAKQCGRAVVPQVAEPCTFEDALGRDAPDLRLMLVEPAAPVDALAVTDLGHASPRACAILIGPEGGWAPGEIAAGSAVATPVTLGGRTLRADAVAVVAVSALLTHWRAL